MARYERRRPHHFHRQTLRSRDRREARIARLSDEIVALEEREPWLC
jgi:hypothetical protein